MEIIHNIVYRCISPEQCTNHSKKSYQYVLHQPHRPRETSEPPYLPSSPPEDEDREDRRKDEGKATTGHCSDQGDEVTEVGHSHSK